VKLSRYLILAASLAFATAPALAQDITLRLSSNDRPGGHIDLMVNDFAERVAERTNGAVKIQVFPNHTLANGDFRTELELTRSGTIDIAVNSTIILGLFVDRRFDVFSIPFNIADFDEFKLVVEGPMGDKMGEWAAEHGYKALGYGINGFRQITNSKRAIHSPDDVKGMKFRVAGTELFLAAFKLLGADSVTMNAQEMIQAMAQGVVDGQENPFISILAFRMWEANQKHVTHWNYVVDPMVFHMSMDKFNSLPADIQQVLVEEAGNAGRAEMDAAEKLDADAVEELKGYGVEITTLTPEEVQVFRDLFAPLGDQFAEPIGADNIALLKSEVEKARQQLDR
jgi:tripartite ATP-independent transporter DctP family solute receptor